MGVIEINFKGSINHLTSSLNTPQINSKYIFFSRKVNEICRDACL